MKIALISAAVAGLALTACNGCTPAAREKILPKVGEVAAYADEACAALHALFAANEAITLVCRFEHIAADGTRRTIEILRSLDAGVPEASSPPPAPSP